jgi:hypothetical protein
MFSALTLFIGLTGRASWAKKMGRDGAASQSLFYEVLPELHATALSELRSRVAFEFLIIGTDPLPATLDFGTMFFRFANLSL